MLHQPEPQRNRKRLLQKRLTRRIITLSRILERKGIASNNQQMKGDGNRKVLENNLSGGDKDKTVTKGQFKAMVNKEETHDVRAMGFIQ